jgi:phage tail sheath protein FI
MPEYLTPAVYVEETSFRSRSIEGVPTSTFGMAGATEYGPVPYSYDQPSLDPVVMTPAPTLVSSMTEYERAFGGLAVDDEPCLLALAARAFFANGGRRLYVSRVFPLTMTTPAGANPQPVVDIAANFASAPVAAAAGAPAMARWVARWPGTFGRRVRVEVGWRRSKNIAVGSQLRGVAPGAAVEVLAANAPDPATGTPPNFNAISVVIADPQDASRRGLRGANNAFTPFPTGSRAFHITLSVTVSAGGDRIDPYSEMELDPLHPRSVFNVLQHRDPPDEFALVWLQDLRPTLAQQPTAGQLLQALLAAGDTGQFLAGGGTGGAVDAVALQGRESDPDNAAIAATGLSALGEIDDIAIVAMPDTVKLGAADANLAVDALIGHCEDLRYRMAVIDPPRDSSISQVREFRSRIDTTYAALYYPWVRIVNPIVKPDPGGPTPMLDIPPSGHVAGIYARSDIERGVHKAPANEVILGIDRFVTNVTFDRQSVLNPEGINALRFFEGRSNRVWGARTTSADPEWKYVNVRRLFIYLEHSIDKSTQWAVFEPNNERLWRSIRQTIEDFLIATWRTGALMGTKPEEAFFVRCDRTTMTQNDLDNGRLICLIGVAPTYPAEFVIFRIGQWTADANS